MKQKILLADDDVTILKVLEGFLRRNDFDVLTATNGKELLDSIGYFNPDLIILDIMMPEIDGLEACRLIRSKYDLPIIFLSAKSTAADRVLGLTLGCDDYMIKPFDINELFLRIKAVLRRTGKEKCAKNAINLPGFFIDRFTRTAKIMGKDVNLTPKEFELLWLVSSHPQTVFTREKLIYEVWGTEYCEDTNIVTILVKRLREKIESDPTNPRIIKTVRGVGYKFGLGSARN